MGNIENSNVGKNSNSSSGVFVPGWNFVSAFFIVMILFFAICGLFSYEFFKQQTEISSLNDVLITQGHLYSKLNVIEKAADKASKKADIAAKNAILVSNLAAKKALIFQNKMEVKSKK